MNAARQTSVVDSDGLRALLVGGAVRDRLLGLPVSDRDWVVLGETPESMLSRGFVPVGREFPVFLHPGTGEEYALARTERKQGRGYAGFVFHADASITLEQDLARRDLTINAMAEDAEGRLVDPFGGREDLAARRLRHVSPAFVEDPLRVLRVARFAARLAPLGFRIAAETRELLYRIVRSGEIDHVVPERVWQETRQALREPRPSAFLQTLRSCAALGRLFPEIDALYGVPQRADYHPEVDCGVHQELVSDAAAALAPGDDLVGWLALTHDLGKALTAPRLWPSHTGHEVAGVAPLRALAGRLSVPREYAELAIVNCREHLHVHRALSLRSATIVDLFDRIDLWRRPQRLEPLLAACTADSRGRAGHALRPYPQADWLRQAAAAARAVSARALLDAGCAQAELPAALRQARIAAIRAARQAAGLV